MAFKPRFKNLGREYLAAIEGAIGCPVDAAIKGKTFELADLTATLRRFYDNWSPESSGLLSGSVLYTDDPEDGFRDLNSASEIEIPLRSQCKHDPGIFIMMGLRDLDRVRSLLMFADAILFWRSEEHTSELQSLMRNSYAVFCLKKKNNITNRC